MRLRPATFLQGLTALWALIPYCVLRPLERNDPAKTPLPTDSPAPKTTERQANQCRTYLRSTKSEYRCLTAYMTRRLDYNSASLAMLAWVLGIRAKLFCSCRASSPLSTSNNPYVIATVSATSMPFSICLSDPDHAPPPPRRFPQHTARGAD